MSGFGVFLQGIRDWDLVQVSGGMVLNEGSSENGGSRHERSLDGGIPGLRVHLQQGCPLMIFNVGT